MSISSTVIGICSVFVQRRWKIDPIDLPPLDRSHGPKIDPIDLRSVISDARQKHDERCEHEEYYQHYEHEEHYQHYEHYEHCKRYVRYEHYEHHKQDENCEQGGLLRGKSEVRALKLPL